jgi:proteasome lid subunit RPN8/RPN11
MADSFENLLAQLAAHSEHQLTRLGKQSSQTRKKFKHAPGTEDPGFLEEYPPLLMATTAWYDMLTDLTTRPTEAGGLLIGPTGHDAVTHYVPDTAGQATGVSFTFDHHGNNALLRRYAPLGLDAKGVGHSHPTGCLRPSQGDLRFVQDCFDLASPAELDRFYLPIVVGRRLFPYVILRGDPLMTIYSRLILF